MILKIFTVYDSKAEAYLQPFFMPSAGVAMRAFGDLVNDMATQFYKHSADYTLFEIGSFDDQNAELSHLEAFINLGVGLEFKVVADIPLFDRNLSNAAE